MALGGRDGLATKTYDSDAMEAMRAYSWPGNVRELENLVRRISALYAEDVITGDIVRMELSDNQAENTAAPHSASESGSLIDSLYYHLNSYFEGHGDDLPPNGLYERVLREVEVPLIELSLQATRGNQIKTAELLGLNRNTLRKKIRDLEIDVVRGSKK